MAPQAPQASIKGNILTIKSTNYKIRYQTATIVVCDTDELQGEFGDEFPKKLLK